MTAVRHPPPYSHQPKGTCKLCAKPILKEDGTPNLRVSWHRECVADWRIATSSGAARQALEARDKGICAYCGVDTATHWVGWRRGQVVVCHGRIDERKSFSEANTYRAAYTEVMPIATWEVEHEIPLWSVDRSDPAALRFWMLENLRTSCIPCHRAKSAREAAQRAKELRIRNKAAGVETRKYRRKIPSRPFSTAHRPLRRKG